MEYPQNPPPFAYMPGVSYCVYGVPYLEERARRNARRTASALMRFRVRFDMTSRAQAYELYSALVQEGGVDECELFESGGSECWHTVLIMEGARDEEGCERIARAIVERLLAEHCDAWSVEMCDVADPRDVERRAHSRRADDRRASC